MKIIDCFIYNNEDLILELRLNFLNKYVDKFILVEAKFDHSGKLKNKFNFDISKFEKFRNKIEYLKIENFPNKFIDWERENYQRNYISNALNNLDNDDQVIISDVDEIPNLQNLSGILNKREKYTAFKQKMFYYKFNLLNLTESPWYGSKMCKMRYLRSPQWLRDQKVKNYPFYRFDKIKWNTIDDGGWHFSNIMTPQQISEKIKSFAHSEYNKPEFTNVENIKNKIQDKKDIFNRNFEFKKLTSEKELPNYIFENKEKFSSFLI
tara:strand:- start:9500 stop:10294 length:795 start_codon:yes stop_codon:yes gene_type:complete